MIVQPDFLEHWKTQMLVDLTGDPAAPLFLLRLWAHCQNRRSARFDGLSASALRAICRAGSIDADRLLSILVECGFVTLDAGAIIARGWEEANASLLSNWEKGRLGGRPKKNPGLTPGKPQDNPMVNPRETEKRRVEKSREDQTSSVANAPSEALAKARERPTREVFTAHVLGMGMDQNDADHVWNVWEENGWTRAQAGKRVPISKWKVALATWKTGGHFPSQKHARNGHSKPSPHTGENHRKYEEEIL